MTAFAELSAAEKMPVRRMDFEFPESVDLVFIDDDPENSYLFVGAWMMLPYLEPFLIRTVRKASEQIKDPALKEEAARFCSQEGQHYQQHQRLNEVVKRIHPAGQKLAELEKEVETLFKDWTDNKSLLFCLAYGEGFESMTCAAARAQMQTGMFDYMSEPIRGLMYWHIMEEVEHRCVAHDVYHALGGNYFHRMRLALFFQKHYLGLCRRFQQAMLDAEPDLLSKYQTEEMKKKRADRQHTYNRVFLPKLLATYMPWYNPAKVALPPEYEQARETYSQLAVSVR